eukprot:30900-Pelagococcus_subviridis.AAC.5
MNVAMRLKFFPYDANFSWKIFFSSGVHGRTFFSCSISPYGSSTSAFLVRNTASRFSSGSNTIAGSFLLFVIRTHRAERVRHRRATASPAAARRPLLLLLLLELRVRGAKDAHLPHLPAFQVRHRERQLLVRDVRAASSKHGDDGVFNRGALRRRLRRDVPSRDLVHGDALVLVRQRQPARSLQPQVRLRRERLVAVANALHERVPRFAPGEHPLHRSRRRLRRPRELVVVHLLRDAARDLLRVLLALFRARLRARRRLLRVLDASARALELPSEPRVFVRSLRLDLFSVVLALILALRDVAL